MDSIRTTKKYKQPIITSYKERKITIKKLVWKHMRKQETYKFKVLVGQKKITDYFK
jgi:hypothetical protein